MLIRLPMDVMIFYHDIVQRLCGNLNILGYEHKKIFFEVSSVSGYMKENMRLLDTNTRKQIFEKPVYTKIKDSVPAQYCAAVRYQTPLFQTAV